MSDKQKNSVLVVLLGIVTSVLTIGGTMLTVGDLKGSIITTINEHSKKLDHHDDKLDQLSTDVTDLKARIHGIASQVGKVPGRVAAKLEDNNNTNHNDP